MKVLKFVVKNFEELLSGLFICAMVIIVIMNVFLRYFFNTGVSWSEEVATICFVWAVFIGASATFKHKMNVGIDFLINLLPRVLQSVIKSSVDLLLIVVTGYITYLGFVFTKLAANKPTAVLGISSAYVNSALIVGFGLMTIYSIIFFVQNLQERLGFKKEEVN